MEHTDGLQVFRDTDSQFYLYSQLIFCVCRVFPCFDQPDIKGILNLSVTCAERFEAAANGAIKQVAFTQDGLKTVVFKPTPPISPYLWTVNVGTFEVFCDYESHRIPLRLFGRQDVLHSA